MKCGPGLDAGMLGHGMGVECLVGILMGDMVIPRGVMPKEEEIRMLKEQERCLTSELDGVRKRLEELRNIERR